MHRVPLAQREYLVVRVVGKTPRPAETTTRHCQSGSEGRSFGADPDRRFLGLCYGVQTRSLASCLRHQPRQEPRALTRMRGSVRGDWRKPVPYRDEYPVGLQNYSATEVGEARIIEDLDYSLKHEDELNPDEMFGPSEDDPKEDWADLDEEEQIERMVSWFNRMFEDPQNQTPYAMDKDSPYNYEYIWGGPYDAAEELTDHFAGIVSESAIEKAVESVQDQDGTYEWAPSSNHPDMRRHDEETLAEQENDLPLLEEVQRRIQQSRTLQLGTSEELAARRELLELIEDFGPLIARSTGTPPHGGMGHNQPPPEMTLPQNIGFSITANVNVIQTQVSAESPDAKKVIEATSALQKAQEEVSDFFRMTKDQVKSQGSKALAAVIVGGLAYVTMLALKWLAAASGFSTF